MGARDAHEGPHAGRDHEGPGGVLLADGGRQALNLLSRWLTLNDVTTGETAAYPDLQPQRFGAPPSVVFERARAACADVARLRVVREDPARGTIEAEHRTLVVRFVDDVTIRVEPDGAGSRVAIRSRSRVGRGDFGQNARTIRELQRAIDRRVAHAS